MARTLRYADWVAGLEKKGPVSAYLFVGPESLLRDQALTELRAAVSGSGAATPIERFQGGEASLAQIV
ncbi:MAG: hypothetical protein KC729_19680, partial [Candidatus Eisenbacteria bacterium]|nr:hypothetical protein [Candidatus Eisenbacteria bacterium]